MLLAHLSQLWVGSKLKLVHQKLLRYLVLVQETTLIGIIHEVANVVRVVHPHQILEHMHVLRPWHGPSCLRVEPLGGWICPKGLGIHVEVWVLHVLEVCHQSCLKEVVVVLTLQIWF